MADYHRLLRVARGEEPADLVIHNGQLLNVLSRDVYPATVGICEDTIAYVTNPRCTGGRCEGKTIIDAAGMWLSPGLIDSHMHIESSHGTPARFADAVTPRGVTTVAQDPHEMANVLGIEGVAYMRRASEGLPLRVFTFVPTCVPSVPGLETAGAAFTAADVDQLLNDPNTLGLAEVMDYWGVVRQAPRITDIVKLGRERGVILTGHVRFEDDRDLNAYLAAHIESDHGYMTAQQMLDRVRLGMVMEVCCAPHRDNIPEAVALWKERGRLEGMVFVTDDVPPSDLLAEGHLDRGVRRAIALGMAPVDAVRAASLAPARRLRRYDLGAIAPGYLADILVLRDLETFDVHLTLTSGRIVARDGAMIAPSVSTHALPESVQNSVKLPPLTVDDFVLRSPAGRINAWVLTQRGRGPLERRLLDVENGIVQWEPAPDLALVAVWHRHGHNANRSFVLLAGSGLQAGALATTYAHDSHNLVVVGRNPADMALAANTLIARGGGYVAVASGEIRALAPLPIAGLLADVPIDELARAFAAYEHAARELGVAEHPISLVTSLPLPVVPRFRPTDMGLVDVDRQTFIPAFEPELEGAPSTDRGNQADRTSYQSGKSCPV
ncbi:MAG: adenine deaminase [Anaerolineae bacterium]|nr:adenine deaminase [Anaerolineae bacterium]